VSCYNFAVIQSHITSVGACTSDDPVTLYTASIGITAVTAHQRCILLPHILVTHLVAHLVWLSSEVLNLSRL